MKPTLAEIEEFTRKALAAGATVSYAAPRPEATSPEPIAPDVLFASENEFQAELLKLAKGNGWKSAHFRPGLTKSGKWRTAVAGDGKGFLDTVLVRERVVWAELKMPGNTLSPTQISWTDALRAAGEEVYCWYPRDWQRITEILK